jgi:quercetin dioxygenase-like cupin family protein
MKRYRLSDFTRGWFIGDFEPSVLRTKNFEGAVRYYKAGEVETRHVHKIADEITVIISGVYKMNDVTLQAGDMVHFAPGEATDFECVVDGATTIIKTPSVIGDKYDA